jgi:hypothetical protein
MCVIAICKSKRIPKAEFFEAFRCNDDGVGMSWFNGDKTCYSKGYMKDEEAWKAYNKLIPEETFPHVVHFRIGSPVKPELTHPFIVSEESKIEKTNEIHETKSNLLFHNGVVSDWKNYAVSYFTKIGKIPNGSENWMDTRVIACMVNEIGEDILNFISGKWALVDSTKQTIFWYGDFEKEEKGIVWSNRSYTVRNYTPQMGYLGAEYDRYFERNNEKKEDFLGTNENNTQIGDTLEFWV